MIQSFLAGFFMFNGIPHLVKGITGQTHMTPFKRVSSPLLNVVWGFSNIVIGLFVLNYGKRSFMFVPEGDDLWPFLIGGFLLSIVAAWLFGQRKPRLPWHKD